MSPPEASEIPTEVVHQQGKVLEGQRKVNLIWEGTQAGVALISVLGYIVMVFLKIPIPTTLDNLIFVIITSYFARTNHTRIGGVGVTDFQREHSRR